MKLTMDRVQVEYYDRFAVWRTAASFERDTLHFGVGHRVVVV